MHWYFDVLRKYAVFSGRARRQEYWMYVLFNVVIGVALYFLDEATGLNDKIGGTGVLGGLYDLAVLLPSIAVSVRRLHDTGRSGWMLFLVLIPCVGAILLLIWMIQDSARGPNQYGENPKEAQPAF